MTASRSPHPAKDPRGWRATRNRVLQQIAVHGRSTWRELSGYPRQSMAKNKGFGFKQLILIQASSAAQCNGKVAILSNSSPKEESWMNFYTQQHKHYCGIDLHAKAMYVCVLDQSGRKLVHKNLPTTPEAF